MCWSLERWGETERIRESRAVVRDVHEEARRILEESVRQSERRNDREPARAGAGREA